MSLLRFLCCCGGLPREAHSRYTELPPVATVEHDIAAIAEGELMRMFVRWLNQVASTDEEVRVASDGGFTANLQDPLFLVDGQHGFLEKLRAQGYRYARYCASNPPDADEPVLDRLEVFLVTPSNWDETRNILARPRVAAPAPAANAPAAAAEEEKEEKKEEEEEEED